MVSALRRLFSRDPYSHVVQEIKKLSELDGGWNGYRAGRILPEAQQQAISFVGRFSDLPVRIPAPSVAPTPNGGVALHWLSADHEVELIFLAAGGEYLVAQRGREDVVDAGAMDHVDPLKDIVQAYVR